ncbi:35128_t:CDS:2, partial [Gigaspora margarita]
EDENDIQELSSIALFLKEGIGYGLEELSHKGLESTLDYLFVKTLRLLYSSESVSDTDCKKDLIKRLVERVKRTDLGERSSKNWAASNAHFIVLERSLEKSIQATLESNLSTLVLLPLEHLLIEVLFQIQVPISIGMKTKEAHKIKLGLFRERKEVNYACSPFDLVHQGLTHKGDRATTSFRNYYFWAIGPERAVQKPCLKITSYKDSQVKILLNRAETLAFQAIDERYRARLGKTQHVFTKFYWLELAGLTMQMQEYLGAVARLHKEKGFANPAQ